MKEYKMKSYITEKILFLGFIFVFCCANIGLAQQSNSGVSATIVDETGTPIEGAQIFSSNNEKVLTGADGKFSLPLKGVETILVKKEGYDTKLIDVTDVSDKIALTKPPFLASESDVIQQGVKSTTRREMTGASYTITPSERLTYDNTQYVRDYLQGLALGVKGSDNIRGLGSALFVIDGVIGRDPNILQMEEVEQITVLKDAHAAVLYGSQARNGVIVINTKRGAINQKKANVSVRYGIKQPISLPKYLNSVDYMTLYNEARANDGLDGYYDPSLIEEYKTSTNPYRYPDVDFYSDEYLHNVANTTDIITEFSGGNEKTQYYVNMGWKYSQELEKTNPDVNTGDNRFNVRGNVDFKVNDWIKSSVDAVAIINTSKNAHSNLLSEGTSFKPNAYAPLLPISMIDTASSSALRDELLAAGKYNGMLLGSSQSAQENAPLANVYAGGYRKDIFRSAQFNNSVDFNLSMITEGLSAKTYLSFDFYDAYKVSISNDFRVYEPTWSNDTITGLTPYGPQDLKDLSESVSTSNFLSRFGFYGLLNYQKDINENNSIETSLIGYVNSQKQEGVIQTNKNAHVGFSFSYAYKQKLFADFSASYVNSIKLPEGNRGGFSPTLGLAYILSEDEFMKDIDFINFLKLKATGGIVKSDIGIDEYFYYLESYRNGSTYEWTTNSKNREKDISQGANPMMSFEDRIDLNIGFESMLFNSVWLEFNYFKTDFDNELTRLTNQYPSFYGIFVPYENYNKDSYQGIELGLEYSKAFSKDLSLSLGGNFLYTQSEVMKRDEVYEEEYRYRTGKSRGAIFGLVDEGFYTESDFTTASDGSWKLNDGLAVPAWGDVQPGDIKYKNQNGDDVIDSSDEVEIGDYRNPYSYGLNMHLKYKGFSLFVLGVGEFGGNGNMDDDYYWVDGDDKYSEVVLGRWTPETANTATFPRLSSGTNNNNFRRSTFWMYDNSFFDIRRAQLTYEFNKNVLEKMGMSNLSVNVSGVNLVEFGKDKDVRQLRIGGNPSYRYFTLGLRASF